MVVITIRGLNELVLTGRLPLNRKYGDWIQKQVLPVLEAGSGFLVKAEDKAIDQEIIQGEELAGENYDIVPLFREIIPKLTLDALDIMEKELRGGKDPMTKRAVADILLDKMKRQFV